jgi:uncharacterized membrane protein (UPF0127 family)
MLTGRLTAGGLGLVAFLALGIAAICHAQSSPLQDLATFPRTSLEIASGSQKHHFDIWIADTPDRQEQGLMFVRELPADQGMLFPLSEPRTMSMWMKNTYVELDMLFIGSDGRVVKIIERAHPHSLETLSSGQSVSAVLEIKGSEAAKRHLHVGDRVTWKPAS